MVDIAVLMTCHNRKSSTLECLKSLFDQKLPPHTNIKVYLVDDGSKDGTALAVKENFKGVKIIQGNGNLFWNGGMRLSFYEANKEKYDYHLWLNDDTFLFKNAVSKLLSASKKIKLLHNKEGIIAGSTCDPKTKEHTYGGLKKNKTIRPLDYTQLIPNNSLQSCDTINGNCVLIHKSVFKTLGNLDSIYTHAMGDTDYGLNARIKGFPLYICENYVAYCKRNPRPKWSNPNYRLKDRWENLISPKGLPPKEWFYFLKKHTGVWMIYYMFTYYLRLLFPRL